MCSNLWSLAAGFLAALVLGGGVEAAEVRSAMPGAKAAPSDGAKGKMVFDQWCLGCHAPIAGPAGPFGFPPAGTNRLQQRYNGAVPAALEERTDLTADFVRTIVRQGLPIMPALRKTEVTDAELDAVIAYLGRKKRK
jgi:mono/diheme cytochrome c family protein